MTCPPTWPPTERERLDVERRLRQAGCVFAEEEAEQLICAAADRGGLGALVGRRAAGEPLEIIVGHVDFDGCRLVVRPGVFVPRQRTRLLVEHAVSRLPRRGQLVDLCTGVGTVAAAVHRRRPDVRIVAADIDPVVKSLVVV